MHIRTNGKMLRLDDPLFTANEERLLILLKAFPKEIKIGGLNDKRDVAEDLLESLYKFLTVYDIVYGETPVWVGLWQKKLIKMLYLVRNFKKSGNILRVSKSSANFLLAYIYVTSKYKEGRYRMVFGGGSPRDWNWNYVLEFNLEKNNKHIFLMASGRNQNYLEKTIYFKNNPDEVMKIYHDLIRKYKEFDKNVEKLKIYFDKTYLPKFKD